MIYNNNILLLRCDSGGKGVRNDIRSNFFVKYTSNTTTELYR